MSHQSCPRHCPKAPCAPTHPVLSRGGTPPGPSSHRSGHELAAPAFHTHGELWPLLPPPQIGRPHLRCTPSPPAPQEPQVTWGDAGRVYSLTCTIFRNQDTPPTPKRHHHIWPGLGQLCPCFSLFPKQLTWRQPESRGSNPLAPDEPPRIGFCEGGLQSSGKGLGMEGKEVA